MERRKSLPECHHPPHSISSVIVDKFKDESQESRPAQPHVWMPSEILLELQEAVTNLILIYGQNSAQPCTCWWTQGHPLFDIKACSRRSKVRKKANVRCQIRVQGFVQGACLHGRVPMTSWNVHDILVVGHVPRAPSLTSHLMPMLTQPLLP